MLGVGLPGGDGQARGVDHPTDGVNGCQETLFSGCEDAVSDIGGVWIVMPSMPMPMPGRPEGGQAWAWAWALAGVAKSGG